MSPNNIFGRSWFFDNNALIFKSDAKCLEMITFTSSFRAQNFILYDVLKYCSSGGAFGIQYLYNIYK